MSLKSALDVANTKALRDKAKYDKLREKKRAAATLDALAGQAPSTKPSVWELTADTPRHGYKPGEVIIVGDPKEHVEVMRVDGETITVIRNPGPRRGAALLGRATRKKKAKTKAAPGVTEYLSSSGTITVSG